MKIFHIADTHLGFSAYNKLNAESGLNQREMDVYNAFSQFVDIALETKPDLILHAGDLFDSVRPTNRAIGFALDQLLRLSQASIPIVLIAGNHETPRLRETGSVFRLFEHLKHVYPVYKNRYECINFPEMELKVHAVPHCTDPDILQEALEQLKPDNDCKNNLAMLHAAVVGVKAFRTSEFNEMEVKSGYLNSEFDYIALGHYHEFCKVDENAYYSGSTERINFLEASHKSKGFIEITMEDINSTPEIASFETDETFYPEPILHELDTRPMIDLWPIDCSTLKHHEIFTEIVRSIESVTTGDKILRLKVQNLPLEVYKTLDFNQFRNLTSDALHFELQYEVTKDDQQLQAPSVKFDVLGNEFKTFIKNEAIEGLDKDELAKLGLEYLANAEGGK